MKIVISLFVLSICFVSCQKVIDLKLQSTTSKIVIQGNINNLSGPYIIKISKTVDFDQSGVDYPAVSNAIVEISDNKGNSEMLIESTTAGIYKTSILQGVPGNTYILKVTIDNKVYTAISTMPYPINIDTITFQDGMFGKTKQSIICFNDPPIIKNYYRIIQKINGIQNEDFEIINDDLYNGNLIRYSSMSQIKSGDSVLVYLQSIDENVYEYFRTASSGSKGNQSAAPSNPISNINNEALGYFNAYSLQEKAIIVP